MKLLFDKEFNEILSGQTIALIAGLIAGVFLAFQRQNFANPCYVNSYPWTFRDAWEY